MMRRHTANTVGQTSLVVRKAGGTMSNSGVPSYGLWLLAVINSAIFIFFAFSFTRPQKSRDWRSLGAFSAFVVALFAEMYGFPLTIYLLSGWLQSRYPQLDVLSHDAGHLWQTIFGWAGDPHMNPLHVLSIVFIIAGFMLLSSAWRVLFQAQRNRTLATTGPYARVRHPQYMGFITIMLGFLLQWPTLLTLAMFPVLVVMYVRLAKREEREVRAEFGADYDRYAAVTPAFFPRLRRRDASDLTADRHVPSPPAPPGAVP
jgi:protein-S-isoprenylcysteine O-methyltransferase Ste14